MEYNQVVITGEKKTKNSYMSVDKGENIAFQSKGRKWGGKLDSGGNENLNFKGEMKITQSSGSNINESSISGLK